MKNVTHWKVTRLTSMPLAALFIYFITQSEYIASTTRMEFISWAKQPTTFIALLVFVLSGFWHAQLGMEEVIIDYVPTEKTQKTTLLVSKIFFSLLGLAALYAVLALKFGNY